MLETASAIPCPKCRVDMKMVHTQAGVMIDLCPRCDGVWLDGGEIFHFGKDHARLHWALEQGLRRPHPTAHHCPRCRAPLTEGGLLSDTLLVDQCGACGGLWFDKDELEQLRDLEVSGHHPSAERRVRPPRPVTPGAALAATSAWGVAKLYLLSVGVLGVLYGMLFLALAIAAQAGLFPPSVAVLVTLVFAGLQFLLSPFLMDWTLPFTCSLRWVTREQLPGHLVGFLERLSKEHNIPFPRFGIIDDGTPNAFSYGHAPSNARIVVTRGLLELLEPEESEAVVGHELGHALHWDMLVMTVAALVPMFLYIIFRVAIRIRGRKNNPGPLIAAAAYLLYLISEYVLLWLSRTREYYADAFSGQATGKPSALASALTKIAYGLAGDPSRRKEGEDAGAKGKSEGSRLDVIRALGIFDPAGARALVASTVSTATSEPGKPPQVDRERLKDAMQWDLWNPWAGWYELHSTHPLPAKRIQRLSDQAEAVGQQPYVRFDRRQPESYWDDFLLDLLFLLAPWLLAAAGIVLGVRLAPGGGAHVLGSALIGFALGSLASTLYRYRGRLFPKASVAGLLRNVKVSNVTSIPATLKGRVIGRGIPGLIWSEDLVVQDSTGYLFLDYRQPLGVIEFLIGLFRTGGIIGKEVTATGWYRRAPIPYFELRTLTWDDGGKTRTSTCYVYAMKLAVEAVLVFAGCYLLLAKL
ncbi:MAG: M48 family metalloprotease [Planctomycetes bacterium]|nr:M48 family metalloprotease [Planctomycetota bacterium]